VVGAVEGEVAQRGELRLDAVEPGAVEGGVGDFDVVAAAAQSPTIESAWVDRCGLKLSQTIAIRTVGG
jgi:hypothetical protein